MVLVEDDGGSKTPCRVNASSGDGDRGQVNQEHCKSNWKRSQDLQFERPQNNEINLELINIFQV